MSQVDQIQKDLQFVRQAVVRRESDRRAPGGVYYVWAAYTAVGFTLIDFANNAAGLFFGIGWFPAVILSAVIGYRWSRQHGELDRDHGSKSMLHWIAGSLLAVGCSIALATISPKFQGPAVGQVTLAMMGIVYFLAGVHMDRSFIWLGLLLIVGSVVVGLVPQPGAWTALGAVIAAGLCAAGIIASRSAARVPPDESLPVPPQA